MAKSKQLNPPAATLEELLDSDAREELIAIERTLERLRADVTRLQKTKTTWIGVSGLIAGIGRDAEALSPAGWSWVTSVVVMMDCGKSLPESD